MAGVLTMEIGVGMALIGGGGSLVVGSITQLPQVIKDRKNQIIK